MTLNPGVVNFTWEKTGGTGVSNSTTGNNFSVSGNRPQQNIFLLNGVEFTGAAENNMTPGGTSGQLLGVDAVREFNVLRDSYGAEYGKQPGGQVIIATQSGTNQLHGSVYEFLRNNALDAPNFFDQGSAPPFQRNQFGAALGGPIQSDKTFLFANYEGLRQHLHQTSAAFVPDAASRAAAVPSVQPLLNLWPIAPAGAPTSTASRKSSAARCKPFAKTSAPLRLDHIFSSRDSSRAFTPSTMATTSPPPPRPLQHRHHHLREQVFSLEETHMFSPSLINVARVGYSRAGYFFTGEPTPDPRRQCSRIFTRTSSGRRRCRRQRRLQSASADRPRGQQQRQQSRIARNLYTFEDRVTLSAVGISSPLDRPSLIAAAGSAAGRPPGSAGSGRQGPYRDAWASSPPAGARVQRLSR